MKLMTVDEYIRECYTEHSRPCKRKIIQLIKEGELKGRRQGKLYYVDIQAEEQSMGNALVNRVLSRA